MGSKYQHSIAIFFLMAIGIMLADSTLHALLHASMQHTEDLHAHHGCSHGTELEKQALSLSTLDSGLSILDESSTETCMRCAEYLAQEHSQLASCEHKLAIVHDERQAPAATAAATSHRVEHASLRGPPKA